MKRILMILTLTIGLSGSALAGDMSTVDSPAPVPSPTPQGIRSEWTSPTTLTLGGITAVDSAEPTLADAWSALRSVFGLVF